MENIAGPPVDGDNFFGREAEVAFFVELLQEHDVLLLGPRRIGKTSIARAVMNALRGSDWLTIEVNAASCKDEPDFVRKLVRAIDESSQSAAKQIFAGIKGWFTDHVVDRIESVDIGGGSLSLGAKKDRDWAVDANRILKSLGSVEQPWLIYVDELPIFFYELIKRDPAQGTARVRRFLDWFRNDVRNLPKTKPIRWLLTGSVGLDSLAQRHGMADTINSLSHQTLKPFSKEQALALLQRLGQSNGLALSVKHATSLVRAVQWPQPYYLQRVFLLVRRQQREQPTWSMPRLIEAAVEALTQPGEDNDFHHWDQRLLIQLGDADGSHAQALLALAAQSQSGHRAESLLVALQERMRNDSEDLQRRKFAELRDILARDGYWQAVDNADGRRYAFLLEPLRRWWQRRSAL